MTTSTDKCSQCSAPVFGYVRWQEMVHPLCLKCWSTAQDHFSTLREANIREINHLTAYMEWTSGLLPGSMPRYALPPPKYKTVIGDFKLNNITIDRSAIGVLNTGSIEGNLQNIDASISVASTDPSLKDFKKVIQEFTEAVCKAQDASQEQQAAIIELLSAITEQVRLPKEKRKPSVVKGVIKEISGYADNVASLVTLWNTAKPVVLAIFGLGS